MMRARFIVYKRDYQITIIARSHDNGQSRVNHVLTAAGNRRIARGKRQSDALPLLLALIGQGVIAAL